MLDYNQIKQRKYIIVEGEPLEVIESQVSRKQANKPVNKTKLKNLISGRTVEHTFHVSDKVHEADMSGRNDQYLYTNPKNGEIWFADPENPNDRFTLDDHVVGPELQFITEKSDVTAMVFTNNEGDEQIIGIRYPIKVELRVTEAPPGIKGDTATGGTKIVTVETGATVNTPLFINVDDIIRVNTDSGDYVERAEKA